MTESAAPAAGCPRRLPCDRHRKSAGAEASDPSGGPQSWGEFRRPLSSFRRIIMAMSKSRQVDIAPDHFLNHCGLSDFDCPAVSLVSQPTFPSLAEEQAARSQEAFRELRVMANQPSPRVAIKVKGRILFINLGDVITVQANCRESVLQGTEFDRVSRLRVCVGERGCSHREDCASSRCNENCFWWGNK